MLEFGVLLTLCASGAMILHAAGVRSAVLPALGFIVGTSLAVAISIAFALMGLPTRPPWPLLTLWGLAAGVWVGTRRRRTEPISWRLVAISIAALAAAVFSFEHLHLVSWHTDSFRYTMMAGLFARDGFEFMTGELLTRRLPAFPLMHAPAALVDRHYLRSFAPVLALATTYVLGWIVWRGLEPVAKPGTEASRELQLERRARCWCTAAAVLLLLTNNRFVWNGFYLNGHLLFAAHLLVLSGCGWLRLRHGTLTAGPTMLIQSLAAFELALLRPEGPLMAALALLPFACCSRLGKWERTVPMVVLGSTVIIWQLHAATYYADKGAAVPASIWELIAVGAALCMAAPVMVWKRLSGWVRWVLPTTEITLWLALLVFAWLQPAIFVASVRATWGNIVLGQASWGSSLLVLTLLVGAALAFTRLPEREVLRLPVTSFVPLSLLLAHLRGVAYRDGDRDSLSRMFIHIVPLAIVLIASAFVADWQGLTRRRVTPSPTS